MHITPQRSFDDKFTFETLNGFKSVFHEDVADLGFMPLADSIYIYSPALFRGPAYIVLTSDEYCRFLNQNAFDFIK